MTKGHDVLQAVSGLVSGRKMFYRVIVHARRVGRKKIDDDSSENPDGFERKPNVRRHGHAYTCRVQAPRKTRVYFVYGEKYKAEEKNVFYASFTFFTRISHQRDFFYQTLVLPNFNVKQNVTISYLSR